MNTTEQVFLFGQVEDGSSYSGKQMESNEVDHEQPMAAPTLASVQDLSCVCRICATPNDYLIPIFEGEGLQNNIADKINKHLPIKVTETDSLPRQLCYHCASTVLAWVELVDCCTQSNLALRNKQDSLLKNVVQTGESNKTDKEDIDNRKPSRLPDVTNITKELVSNENKDTNTLRIHKEISKKMLQNIGEVMTDEQNRKHFYCKLCNKSMIISSVNRHMRIHRDEKSYNCQLCGINFRDAGNLSRHTRNVHVREKHYLCDICSVQFSRRDHLENHIKTHMDDRHYICELCGKRFKSESALRIHRGIHLDEYKYLCAYCQASFKRKQELSAHITVHSGDRLHVCGVCGRTFRLKGNLTSHLLTHKIILSIHKCQYCNKVFKLERYLKKHVIRCHIHF